MKGHWLAVERESPAGREREEIKQRGMGVLKENHMDGSMTDWPEL